MATTPRRSLKQLARLRGRERLVRFAWGAARWVAVVLLVLAAACFADWQADPRSEQFLYSELSGAAA